MSTHNHKWQKEKIDNNSLSLDDAIREIKLWSMRKDYGEKEQKNKNYMHHTQTITSNLKNDEN